MEYYKCDRCKGDLEKIRNKKGYKGHTCLKCQAIANRLRNKGGQLIAKVKTSQLIKIMSR